jgi:hypothetical protein
MVLLSVGPCLSVTPTTKLGFEKTMTEAQLHHYLKHEV